MFLKLLVCFFSIAILIKNISYSKYELCTNHNIIGAISIGVFSFAATLFLNMALFFIKF